LIVDYHLHDRLTTYGPLAALKIALKGIDVTDTAELIHHSDRGVQYCSDAYVAILSGYPQIKISMTESGDPYENAVAERVNGILKTEFGLNNLFATSTEMRLAVSESVTNYNLKRPHASCDYLTPVEAHQRQGVLAR